MQNQRVWIQLKRYPELWILITFSLILFPLRHLIAGTGQVSASELGSITILHPLFLAALGLAIFLIPGLAIVAILGDDGTWWERLPLGFIASLASVGIVSQTAIFLHTNIDFVLRGFLILTGILIAVALVRGLFFSPEPRITDEVGRPPVWMWAILLVMVAIVFVFAFYSPLDGDHPDATAYVQNARFDQHIMVQEPKFNTGFAVSPRFLFDDWLIDQALISRITDQNPVDQFQVLRLLMTLLTLAAFYSFAHRITGRKDYAAIATIAWSLYLITSNRGSVAGYETVVRADLDKVIAGFIILPLTLGILKAIFDFDRRRDWFWLGICALAAMLTHPLAVGLIGLSVAGFGVAELATHRTWGTFRRLALAAGILTAALMPSLIFALFQGVRNPEAVVNAINLTDTRDPSMSRMLRGALDQERILILGDGSYIMHPRLVFQSFNIPAFLALPLLFLFLRRSRGMRMLFGMLTVVPLVVLISPVADTIGRFTTPWLFYRLHWPISLAAVVTLGWGVGWVYDRVRTGTLPRFQFSLPRYALPVLGVGVWLAIMLVDTSTIRSSFMFLYETQQNVANNSCVWAGDILRPLQQLVPEPGMVLADPSIDVCTIAYAPYAGVMEWRSTNVIRSYIAILQKQVGWDRLFDERYFLNTDVVDARLLQIIQRWNVKVVVKRDDAPLDSELRHLPGMFKLEYTANDMSVYTIRAIDRSNPIIQANSLLQDQKWSEAIQAFETLQSSDDADTRYLAEIGLGKAYQQVGRLDDALRVWQQAAVASQDALPLTLIGEVDASRGAYADALAAYRQAVARQPRNYDAQFRLGDMYYLTHQPAAAESIYRQAAAIYTQPGSTAYDALLGQAWSNVGEYSRAADVFLQGAHIFDQRAMYVSAMYALLRARRFGDAERLIAEMQSQDPWDWNVHLGRGALQLAQGNPTAALAEYNQALDLHRLARGAYNQIAAITASQKGTRVALQQLQNLVGYRVLHFGDALIPASKLEASLGNVNQATSDEKQAIVWDGLNPVYFRAQADMQLSLGQVDTAASGYRTVLGLDSNSSPVYIKLADIAQMRGDMTQAQGYLVRAIEAAPYNPGVNVTLARFFQKQGLPDRAQSQYQIALDKNPKDPGTLSSLGDFHANRGEFAQALENYTSAVAVNPFDSTPYLGMGTVYRDQGEIVQATQAITQAIKLEPGLGKPYAALASINLQQGKPDAAEQELKLAVDRNPGFVAGSTALAVLYLDQGKPNDAQAVLKQLQQQFPLLNAGYIGLGLLAERRLDYNAAADSYRQAIARVAPTRSGVALLALGNLQLRQGQTAQALQSFQTALKEQPTLANVYVALSQYYAQTGDFSNAEHILQQGLTVNPGSASLGLALGNLQLSQGETDQAAATFKQTLAVSPGATGVAIALANISAGMGQPSDALMQVTQVEQHWSGVSSLLKARANLELANGQPQAALQTAQKFTALDPGHADSWIALGLAQSTLGHLTDAETAFRKATQVQPGDVTAWLAIGQFLVVNGQTDAAMSAVRQAIAVNASDTQAHLDLGDLLDRAGKQSAAVTEYQSTVQIDHRDDRALLKLGTLSETQGKLNDAAEYLNQALTTSVTDPQAYAARAELTVRIGQSTPPPGVSAGQLTINSAATQARQTLEKAIAVVPGNCMAYKNLGDFLAQRGDLAGAESNYQQSLALPGCPSDAHLALGNLYGLQAKPQDTIAEYKQAIAALPGSALPYAALAQVYLKQGQSDQALATYVQATSRVPASDLLTVANGETLIVLGQVQQGFDYVLRAANLRPTSVRNLLTLGSAYEFQAQYTSAEQSYQKASQADQSAPEPYLALGALDARLARFDEALAADQKALALAPGNPRTQNQLGAYYESRGQYDVAIDAYQKGFNADQRQVASLLALGNLYQKLGRLDDAERTFQQALAVPNPGIPSVGLANASGQVVQPPGSAQVLIALGGLYELEGNVQKAQTAYQNAISVAPAQADGYVRLAQFYQAHARPADAFVQLQAAIKAVPASASAYVALGELRQSQSDWKGAEQAYRQAAQVAPVDPSGFIHLGKLYQLQGRQSDAQAQFQAAVKAAPASLDAGIALAAWQQFNAHWDQAEQAYKQVITIEPGAPEGYIGLSKFYQSRGKFTDALAQSQAAVKIAPASAQSWIALGDLQQSQVKRVEAEHAFKQAVSVSPADPLGYIRLGRLYQAQAQKDAAAAQFQAAVKAAPGTAVAQIALGDWYASQVNWNAAEAAYTQAIALKPADPVGYLDLGQLYVVQARTQDAANQFQAALKAAPDSAMAYSSFGEWNRLQANAKGAEENYRHAIQINPTNPVAYVDLAQLYQVQGKFSDARTQLSAAANAAPASPLAYTALGNLLQTQAKWREAEQAYQQAIARAPGDTQAYIALGSLYVLQGNTRAAEQNWKQAIAMVPSDPLAYTHLGDAYQTLGRPQDALTQLQSAIKVSPASVAANIALGNWYNQQANFSAAENAFRQAVDQNPGNAQSYVALTLFLEERGKSSDAEELAKQAVTANPGNVDMAINLGRLYLAAAKPDLALPQFQTATNLEPGDLDARIELADVFFNQAQFTQAEQTYASAMSMAPGLSAPYIAIGDFYANRGNWEAAARAYQHAITIEPTVPEAFIGLVRVDLLQRKRSDALKVAQNWTDIAPAGETSAWMTLGQVKRANGDFTGSAAAYQTALDRYPGDMDSYVGLSETLRAQAMFGDAIALLNHALGIMPNNVPAILSLGLAQEALGQTDAAAESFDHASALDQSSADALVARARLAVANAQPEQGIQLYQQAIAAQPTSSTAYDDLVKLYLSMPDLNSALAIAKKENQAIPSELRPRILLEQVYVFMLDEGDALNTLQQALPLFPHEEAVTYTGFGYVYYHFNNADAARTAFETAQARDPNLIDPYLGEGDVYQYLLGDSQTAKELYQQAENIDYRSVDPYAKTMLIYARERQGRPTLMYSPDTCPFLPRLIGCQIEALNLHNGLDNTLKAQYEANAAAQPDSEQAQMALAVLYEAYRMYDQSIATWQRVLQLDPANQDVYIALSHDYSLKEQDRQPSAYAMGQAMGLGVDGQYAYTRLAQLYNDQMTSVQNGATYGSQITIQGTANGSNTGSRYPFSYYKIEVGAGIDPKEWKQITLSHTSVTHGTLATWDTSDWADGVYTIRLVVVDTGGNYRPYDMRTIHLQHSADSE